MNEIAIKWRAAAAAWIGALDLFGEYLQHEGRRLLVLPEATLGNAWPMPRSSTLGARAAGGRWAWEEPAGELARMCAIAAAAAEKAGINGTALLHLQAELRVPAGAFCTREQVDAYRAAEATVTRWEARQVPEQTIDERLLVLVRRWMQAGELDHTQGDAAAELRCSVRSVKRAPSWQNYDQARRRDRE